MLFLSLAACGTQLDDRSLRIAIALRLGSPVCASGIHGLSCRKSAGRMALITLYVSVLIRRALLTAEILS